MICNKDSSVHIAQDNIKVYKVLRNNGLALDDESLFFPHADYKLALESSIEEGKDGTKFVNRGYHAYLDKASLEGGHHFNAKLVEFTIPKHSRYVFGDDGDIMSDAIVTGDLKPIVEWPMPPIHVIGI